MRALQYTPSIARYAAARTLRDRGGAGALRLADVPRPRPPGPEWRAVRPRLSGICGSDQALVGGAASPYLASLTSGPFVPGHEVVGELADGARVVVEPALGCVARGVEPPCESCAEGRHALCENVVDGDVAAGLQIGFCRDTGGGWSEGLVAHRAQLHPVPDELADEDAVLVEPLACALHAAGRLDGDARRVAVIGAGTIGLLTVAALRRLRPELTILCVAKHPAQETHARRLGADHVGDLYVDGARLTGARRLVGHGGRELLLGGLDAVLDCVGSGASLEAAVGAVRPRGTVVLVGMPGAVRADLALAWQREVCVRGAYGYGYGDFPAAIELAGALRPGRLVGRGWALGQWRRALDDAPRAARAGRVKTVFDLR